MTTRTRIYTLLCVVAICWTAAGFQSLSIGLGLSGIGSLGNPLIVQTTAVRGYLTGTGTLTFTAIPSKTCQNQTISVPGAAVGYPVETGPPVTALVALGITAWSEVSASDVVTVRACNVTSGAVTIAASTWNVDVRTLPVHTPTGAGGSLIGGSSQEGGKVAR